MERFRYLAIFNIILILGCISVTLFTGYGVSGQLESLDAEQLDEINKVIDEYDAKDEDGLEAGDLEAEELVTVEASSTPAPELYTTPQVDNYYIYEHFDDDQLFHSRWILSRAKKDVSPEGKYDGQWSLIDSTQSLKGDKSLIMKSRARHHAVSVKLDKELHFNSKVDPVVLQYEVQFRNGQECGGAYIKLLRKGGYGGDLSQLNDKTPYSIMFGPDKCGNDMKLHFIFQHKNPVNNTMREIHWKNAGQVSKIDEVFKDNQWHLLRLVMSPDQTYEIQLDRKTVGKGSLLEDFRPSVNPPAEIEDPSDQKPEEWDEREKIPDPDAVKPDDWDETQTRQIPDPKATKPEDWLEDEPETVSDPDATKPSDWDNEMDGEWEPAQIPNPKCESVSGCGPWSAPLVDNPKYKGKWRAPMIANPNYKGKWSPRKIPNPEYFEDKNPFNLSPVDAIAFELWTISDGIAFDNIVITDDIDVAEDISFKTYQIKKSFSDAERDNIIVRAVKYTNQRPWLWAVYTLLLGIPIALFISFCCISNGPKRPESSMAATLSSTAASRGKASKSDLDEPLLGSNQQQEEGDLGEGQGNEDEGVEEGEAAPGDEDDDDIEEINAEEAEEDEDDGPQIEEVVDEPPEPAPPTRRRRARKE